MKAQLSPGHGGAFARSYRSWRHPGRRPQVSTDRSTHLASIEKRSFRRRCHGRPLKRSCVQSIARLRLESRLRDLSPDRHLWPARLRHCGTHIGRRAMAGRARCIRIQQRKTGRRLWLPPTNEVAAALLEYLRRGRPHLGDEAEGHRKGPGDRAC